LAKRGHDVQVFTTNVDGTTDSAVPTCSVVDLDGVKVTYFPSRHLRRLYRSHTMAKALAVQMTSFDIAHLHSVFLWPTWAAARAARAARIPYVLAPRGMLVPELILRKSRWIKRAWITFIERRNVTMAAAIHATSELEARDVRRFGWTLQRVVVIPNGVDEPEDAAGASVSIDVRTAIGNRRVVLSLGRIVWKKGIGRLIAALPAVPGAHLVIAGDDPERHATILSREVERLGLADRVTILPRHVEGADKESLFASAAVFAMPSLSENFGIAAVEAMRRGVPVVVTPEVGAADLVVASGGGIVIEGEPGTIADGLNRLLEDPIASRAMGEAGRTYVSAWSDWASVAARVEDLYASILSSGDES
jgi:glycosyltransferase involved in cell wall biosynthesis